MPAGTGTFLLLRPRSTVRLNKSRLSSTVIQWQNTGFILHHCGTWCFHGNLSSVTFLWLRECVHEQKTLIIINCCITLHSKFFFIISVCKHALSCIKKWVTFFWSGFKSSNKINCYIFQLNCNDCVHNAVHWGCSCIANLNVQSSLNNIFFCKSISEFRIYTILKLENSTDIIILQYYCNMSYEAE